MTQVGGFLTVDMEGLSKSPFSNEKFLNIQVGEGIEWTALPVIVVGVKDGNEVLQVSEIRPYPHMEGANPEVDAFYFMIESGYQEQFEDMWTDVYNIIHGEIDDYSIDSTLFQNILEDVSGKEEYGDMRDITTDCLMFIKEFNEKGITDSSDSEAAVLYNRFYNWFKEISVCE